MLHCKTLLGIIGVVCVYVCAWVFLIPDAFLCFVAAGTSTSTLIHSYNNPPLVQPQQQHPTHARPQQ